MRIGAIADIHGNCLALEAVLADIANQNVDRVVNLGDHLSGPLEAGRTADLLMSQDHLSIRGNHDRLLIETDPADMDASDLAAYQEMTQEHHAWLQTLPATDTIGDEIFLCHGTPAHDETYWLEAVDTAGQVMRASQETIEARGEGLSYPLIFCAHTHIPRAVRLSDGRQVVNPGSVGCPAYTDDAPVDHVVATGTPDASYAIVEKVRDDWQVSFRMVPYDHMAMSRLAAARGRPDWAEALATGWIN
ncbi:MAG: metallophosphoesterase [Paracoccaceae bacterium]